MDSLLGLIFLVAMGHAVFGWLPDLISDRLYARREGRR